MEATTQAGEAAGRPHSSKSRLLLPVLAALLGIYLAASLATAGLWHVFGQALGWELRTVTPDKNLVFTLSFSLFFLPWLYLFPCLLARKFLVPDVRVLAMYMGATLFFAQIAEVGIDTLFVQFIGRPAWQYKIWPAHHGYISHVGAVMWPLYGFFMYFLHEALASNPRLARFNTTAFKALLLGVDAMTLEVLANLYALMLFQSYYFFYLRPDLHHFTTFEIFLPYVFMGCVGIPIVNHLKTRRRRGLAIGAAFFILGLFNLHFVF